MPIPAMAVDEQLPAHILHDDLQLDLIDNEYELINVGRIDESDNGFGLSTVKSLGSQEQRQDTNTKLLYSERSLNHFSSKSNDHSKRRYDKCPQEERIMMNTELSDPVIASRDCEDPFTKYIVHVPSRQEESAEHQTIAT